MIWGRGCVRVRLAGSWLAAHGGKLAPRLWGRQHEKVPGLSPAKYGVPAVGQRIFISSQQMLDGWKDVAKAFTGVVPASS